MTNANIAIGDLNQPLTAEEAGKVAESLRNLAGKIEQHPPLSVELHTDREEVAGDGLVGYVFTQTRLSRVALDVKW